MTRPYSQEFVMGLHHANPKRIGVKLAKVCVKANLPSIHVAKAFGVSRMAIHSWFRGSPVRDKNNTRIEHFIELVEQGLSDGLLPTEDLASTKKYLESEIKPNLIRV
tara:strand:+ start:1015 stop:1335 length:321 start_codon:yes stop_codon:yes gene_type:complete